MGERLCAEHEGGAEVLEHDGAALAGVHCVQEVPHQVSVVTRDIMTQGHHYHCRSLRTLMVMLVSSVWHGVHPGYYLSLGSVPFCLMVSRIVTFKEGKS